MFLSPLSVLGLVPVLERIQLLKKEGRMVVRLGGLDLGDFKFVSGEVRLEGEPPEEARGQARTELLEALQKGPRTIRELSRMGGFGEATLLRALEQLENERRISVFPRRIPGGWTTLYALPQHASRASEQSGFERRPEIPPSLQAAIQQGVDRLRSRLLRNPDVEEIALELDRDPEESAFRQAVYRAAGEMGWRPPTPRERDEARRKLDYVPALAGLLKKGITPPDATLDEIRRARDYIEEHEVRLKPLHAV